MSGNIALSGTEFSVSETESAFGIAILRSGDFRLPVEVQYNITIDQSSPNAADPSEVQLGAFTITIPAGASQVTVDVPLRDDSFVEGTESFFISLINVDSGMLLFPRTAKIDILDDEKPETAEPVPPLVSDYHVVETPVIANLNNALTLDFLPIDGSKMFVGTKTGRILLHDIEGETTHLILDIQDQVNKSGDRGLLDIAFHPEIEAHPYLYVFYVVDPPEVESGGGNAGPDGAGNRYSYLSRFTLDADTGYTTFVENSEVVLLGGAGRSLADIAGGGAVNSSLAENMEVPSSEIDPISGTYKQDYLKVDSASHAGGSIEFGPDGALYVSVGDGTSFNLADPRSVSVQDVDSLSGKILRIDPLTGLGLPDNPFVAEAGGDLSANAAKVYQFGLRNPYSMAFDADGDLFVTNTGWTNYESIFSGPAGANFGWPWFEGDVGGVPFPAPGYSDLPEAQAFYDAVAAGEIDVTVPYASFSQVDEDPGFEIQAITGADDVIASPYFPESLQDHYVFTDIVEGEVYAINTNDRRDVKFLYETDGLFAPSHFKQGPDGRLYYVNHVSGEVGYVTIADAPVVFGRSSYVKLQDGLSRDAAVAQASDLGGTLLRIESAAENKFIFNTFYDGNAIRLDPSDAEVEGIWQNSDGLELTYTNWLPKEPNNYQGVHNYAYMSGPKGEWGDQSRNGSGTFDGVSWSPSVVTSIVEIVAPPLPPPGSSYVEVGRGLTREEALAAAEALDGTLLRIDDQAENDYILETFYDGNAIHLDASDEVTEGVWLNSDGVELTFTNWLPNEPNNAGGTQDWAYMAGPGGKWGDHRAISSGNFDGEAWSPSITRTIVEFPTDEFVFNESRYVRVADGLTRDEALEDAARLDGTLLRIESQAENDYIFETFYDGNAIRLDASDEATEGVWLNSDGSAVGYTNWLSPNEPNNINDNQHYAYMSGSEGEWGDQSRNGSGAHNGVFWSPTIVTTIIEIDIA